MGNKQPLGLSCDVGKARIATGGLRASIISPRTSYRLDNRQCSGDAKDSGEPEVAHCQRETTAKSSECRERDQLVQSSVHLRQFHLTNARRMGLPCPMV